MPKNLIAALFFYLQARFAIRKRRQCIDYYGDDKVEQTIDKALETVVRQLGIEKPPLVLPGRTPELITSMIPLRKEDFFEMRLRQTENGAYAVTVVCKDGTDVRRNRPMLLTLPEALFCGYSDKLQYTLENARIRLPEPKGSEKKTVTLRFERIEDNVLLFDDEEVARIEGEWTLKVPKEQA